MIFRIAIFSIIALFGMIQPLAAWEDQLTKLEVTYLSDRVINVSPAAGYPSYKAIKTSAGLVVIGTLYDLELTQNYRRIIEQEFGRNDFRYVISTSARVLDQGGMEAYPDAVHIAHRSVKDKMIANQDRLDEVIAREVRVFNTKAARSRSILAEDPPGPHADQKQYNWMMFCQNIADYLESHPYKQKLPDQVFEQDHTIQLGDCPIELIDFGPSQHGNSMIINLPSEGLLIASAFSRLHLAPLPSPTADSSTVKHWLKTMDDILKKKETIKRVYCGFSNSLGAEDLVRSRKYMGELWDAVARATEDGLDIETARRQLSLDGEFAYVKEWPIFAEEGKEWVEEDHARHFDAYWRWQHECAAQAVEEALTASGLAAAAARFREIKEDTTNLYYFQENLFNGLGYRLLGEDRLPEAIAVFRMNVETHPESGNTYDSYGEALLKDGQTESALEMYRQALKLDSTNANARQVLQEQGALEGN